jgi:dephospho-CoA kinase
MASRRRAIVVGITGGIASGKTVLARELGKRGALVLDADEVGREVVESSPQILAAVREAFGDGVFDAEGRLLRRRLGDRVFADAESLARLNAIVRPALVREVRRRVDHFRRSSPGRVLVVDAALLVEWGARDWVDYLVTVEAEPDRQVARVRARDGSSEGEARNRVVSQLDPARRRDAADEVLRNDGTLEDMGARAEDLWRRVQHLSGAGGTEVGGES